MTWSMSELPEPTGTPCAELSTRLPAGRVHSGDDDPLSDAKPTPAGTGMQRTMAERTSETHPARYASCRARHSAKLRGRTACPEMRFGWTVNRFLLATVESQSNRDAAVGASDS
jgi:hypothetical protein